MPLLTEGGHVSSRRGSNMVAAGILVSRLAGFARDRAIQHWFGLSATASAFRAAMQIPNLLQNLLGEGVLSASFVPVYVRLLEAGDEREAGRLAGAIAGLLTALVAALALVGVVLARPLTTVIAAGFRDNTALFELTVTLLRIVFPGVGFLVLSAWCLGILNSHRRFFLSYVAPVFWNVAQIGALAVVGSSIVGGVGEASVADLDRLVRALAWGTVLGGLLQFGVQLPMVLRLQRGIRLSTDREAPGVATVLRSFGHVIAGRGGVQLGGYLDLFLASFLAATAVAAMRTAQTLYLLPIALFGMSIAAAELPELSRGDADPVATQRRLDAGLRRVAFYVMPSMVAFLALGDVIVGGLFRTGAFGRDDEVIVWILLAALSVGLLATTASRLLQSAMYAAGQARIPARLSMLRVAVAALLGAATMWAFEGFAIEGGAVVRAVDLSPTAAGNVDALRLGPLGLSIASAIGAWLEFALLRRACAVRLRLTVSLGGGDLRRLATAAVPSTLMALAARSLVAGLPRIPGALMALAAVGLTWLGFSASLGLAEARVLIDGVGRRIRR